MAFAVERLEENWLEHIKSKFPRRVNTPKSEIVFTRDRYIFLIWRHLLLSPIWVGIYGQQDIKISMYDKFCFDLDHDTDLELAHMDMLTLQNHFLTRFGREPRIYFSGKKGFHVYLDFYPLVIGIENFQDTFKVFVDTIEKETGVTTIDHHCIEPNRVIRLPFTPHEKSKRWCIPINPAWDLAKVLRESIFLDDCWNIDTAPKAGDDRVTNAIFDCKHQAIERKKIPMAYPKLDNQSLEGEIVVIQRLAPFVKDGRHRILHYMLIPRLIQAEYDVYETHQICKEWIEETGKSYHNYRDYVERGYYRNQSWHPWSFNKFFYEYPQLASTLVTILEECKHEISQQSEESPNDCAETS